jgi:hypothetical protein
MELYLESFFISAVFFGVAAESYIMYILRKNILAMSIRTTYKALNMCNFEHNVERG